MKYSAKKPTKPGYYFERHQRRNSDDWIVNIIQIVLEDNELIVYFDNTCENLDYYINSIPNMVTKKLEFAGPIKEPKS